MAAASPLFSNGEERYTARTSFVLCLLFALSVAIGVALPVLVESNSLYNVELTRQYQPGELADEDVIAPYDFSFLDEIATEQAREDAARAVLPRFTYSVTATSKSLSDARSVADALSGTGASVEEAAANLGLEDPGGLSSRWAVLDSDQKDLVAALLPEVVESLLMRGVYDLSDITLVEGEGHDLINADAPSGRGHETGETLVYTSQLNTQGVLDAPALALLSENSVDLQVAGFEILMDFVNALTKANMRYDSILTDSLRAQARAATEPVVAVVNRGDYILKYDTIVTEQALQTINNINTVTVDLNPLQIAAETIFLAVIFYVGLQFLHGFIERHYRVLTYTYIYLISFPVMLALSFFAVSAFPDAPQQGLPFLMLPLLMTQLTSRKRIGFVCGAVYSCFVVFLPTSDLTTFFYLIFSIEVSLLLCRFGVTRLDMIYQAFYTALANIAVTCLFHFISGGDPLALFRGVAMVTVNVAGSYLMVSVLLPLLEHFLNIPTVFRLHELATADSPAISRLRTQAVGTYNHSNNVSDMAYNAAKEIGANAELAKVGGLYHDIGKGDHPEYFVENQGGGPNVHNEMKHTLSAAVIKSHVKLGVEKGKEMGLPQEVLDIIEQHHGNDIISFFYNKALEEAKQSKTPVQVNEEDFRYTSEIPQTKEAGIVMLADCFEAASRTLKKPTTQRYEKLFTSILVSKMNGAQLDDCKLSMAEIQKIKRVFVHQAFGRDHMRIQYTGKEDNL